MIQFRASSPGICISSSVDYCHKIRHLGSSQSPNRMHLLLWRSTWADIVSGGRAGCSSAGQQDASHHALASAVRFPCWLPDARFSRRSLVICPHYDNELRAAWHVACFLQHHTHTHTGAVRYYPQHDRTISQISFMRPTWLKYIRCAAHRMKATMMEMRRTGHWTVSAAADCAARSLLWLLVDPT